LDLTGPITPPISPHPSERTAPPSHSPQPIVSPFISPVPSPAPSPRPGDTGAGTTALSKTAEARRRVMIEIYETEKTYLTGLDVVHDVRDGKEKRKESR